MNDLPSIFNLRSVFEHPSTFGDRLVAIAHDWNRAFRILSSRRTNVSAQCRANEGQAPTAYPCGEIPPSDVFVALVIDTPQPESMDTEDLRRITNRAEDYAKSLICSIQAFEPDLSYQIIFLSRGCVCVRSSSLRMCQP
eukprot:PDM76624.1 hypothetical protein PRIPAC_42990 [Pristionchus pacificus]